MKKLIISLLAFLVLFSFMSCDENVYDGGKNGPNQAVDADGHKLVSSDYVLEDGKLYVIITCSDDDCDYLEKKFVSDASDVLVATPENVNNIINSVNTGIIYLSAGTYSEDIVFSHSPAVSEAYKSENGEYVKVEELANTGVYHYFRTIENMSVVGSKDAIIDGAKVYIGSGHCYGQSGAPCVDPMRPDHSTESTNNSYYNHTKVSNISFDNLNFINKGKFYFSFSIEGCGIDGLKIENCSFEGVNESSGLQAIHALRDSVGYYKNVVIENINVNHAFQGVFIQGAENLVIRNSYFNDLAHNAIAIQNGRDNKFSGEIVIENNIMSNGLDRAIRFGEGESASISITNNTFIDICDDGNDVIKSQALTGCSVVFEDNTYNAEIMETVTLEGDGIFKIVH